MSGYPDYVVDAALTLPPTPERVYAALDGLGGTPNHVADTLYALGVRGKRGCETGCVIAEWAVRTYPDHVAEVQVGDGADTGKAWLRLTTPDGDSFELRTPPAVAICADAFDDGHYPDLERETP